MKKIKTFFPVLFLSLAFLCTQSNAQVIAPCSAYPSVGNSCVGSCAPFGVINYTVAPCSAFVHNFCVVTDNSNLCPSHIAIARVYVNGVAVAGGNITAAGSTISFSAPCGSNITVVAKTKQVNPNIQCIVFGDVNFSLRRQ